MNTDIRFEPLDLDALADSKDAFAHNIWHAMAESHVTDRGGIRLIRRRSRLGERTTLRYFGCGDLLSDTIESEIGDPTIDEVVEFLEDAGSIKAAVFALTKSRARRIDAVTRD